MDRWTLGDRRWRDPDRIPAKIRLKSQPPMEQPLAPRLQPFTTVIRSGSDRTPHLDELRVLFDQIGVENDRILTRQHRDWWCRRMELRPTLTMSRMKTMSKSQSYMSHMSASVKSSHSYNSIKIKYNLILNFKEGSILNNLILFYKRLLP